MINLMDDVICKFSFFLIISMKVVLSTYLTFSMSEKYTQWEIYTPSACESGILLHKKENVTIPTSKSSCLSYWYNCYPYIFSYYDCKLWNECLQMYAVNIVLQVCNIVLTCSIGRLDVQWFLLRHALRSVLAHLFYVTSYSYFYFETDYFLVPLQF
jgi:hypothetical protein